MSRNYPGGFITRNFTAPTIFAAPGVWTLDQASYYIRAGTWPFQPIPVEDVFSTWLYTGNGSSQTITNGVDLAGKGGLVWIKQRNAATYTHNLVDTARGFDKYLYSSATDAQETVTTRLQSFNSTGFSLGSNAAVNGSGNTMASWTFRDAPRFFDVVTYTGNGASDRSIAHNLGVAPGMIVVKKTNAAGTNWIVYHRSLALNGAFPNYLILNTTAIADGGSAALWASVPTSTTFSVGSNTTTNENGATYVAYLWAHDTASDGVIQCGTYTGNGSTTGPTVTLGWEPQWLMVKRASGGVSSWQIIDNMRGMPVGSANATLQPNLADAESSVEYLSPTATGFQLTSTNAVVNGSGSTYVYVAIRRGPMRTPTLGTSVFAPVATNSTNNPQTGFPLDLWWLKARDGVELHVIMDRMRQTGKYLSSDSTAAEANNPANYYRIDNMTGGFSNGGTFPQYIHWCLRRAPSFFDTVCWTGNAAASQSISHNLGVVPELIITKRRPAAEAWQVYSATTGASAYLNLNTTAAVVTGNTNRWNATAPTATIFTVGSAFQTSDTYVAYLFASCPGVSKVGSYTGTGALQTINCAFTTGARFVLIKRTDSTGDWFVWDSARGISSGNDPYLLLNTTAAETTGTNYVDTDTTGFKVTAAAPAGINANGGTYIFLAIA